MSNQIKHADFWVGNNDEFTWTESRYRWNETWRSASAEEIDRAMAKRGLCLVALGQTEEYRVACGNRFAAYPIR